MDNSPPTMLGPPYRFPPITEAVVEFRIEGKLTEAELEAVSAKLGKHYPNQKIQKAKEVKVDLDSATADFIDRAGRYQRANDDQNEIVLLGEQSYSISQLAVYPSWEHFHNRIVRDRAFLRKIVGYKKITRIGMRYLNRIDVPIDDDNLAHYEKYLKLKIEIPPKYPVTSGYNLMVQIELRALKCVVNIRSQSTKSPVPNHAAFILDIDVIRMVEVPQRDNDIDKLLSQMRVAKNDLFESFITDVARKRFMHEQPLQ